MKVFILFKVVSNGVIETKNIAHPFYFSVSKCEVVKLDCFEQTKVKVLVIDLDKNENAGE